MLIASQIAAAIGAGLSVYHYSARHRRITNREMVVSALLAAAAIVSPFVLS